VHIRRVCVCQPSGSTEHRNDATSDTSCTTGRVLTGRRLPRTAQMDIHIMTFRVVTSCSLAGYCMCFEGSHCLHIQGTRALYFLATTSRVEASKERHSTNIPFTHTTYFDCWCLATLISPFCVVLPHEHNS
jgi:hypothetical protein